MKRAFLCLSLVLPFVAQATVTVQIQSGNFANASNVATNGMPYAIVVSTVDSSFSPGLYDAFDVSSVGAGGGKLLTIGGVETDDWYTFGSALNSTQAGPPPDFFTGYANQVSTIFINADDSNSPITSGDAFAIIWFADGNGNEGSGYGFYENANLLVPNQGATTNFSADVGNSLKSADYSLVPEPSAYAAVLGLAVLAFVHVRRRK